MDVWETTFMLGRGIFRGCVSFRECMFGDLLVLHVCLWHYDIAKHKSFTNLTQRLTLLGASPNELESVATCWLTSSWEYTGCSRDGKQKFGISKNCPKIYQWNDSDLSWQRIQIKTLWNLLENPRNLGPFHEHRPPHSNAPKAILTCGI